MTQLPIFYINLATRPDRRAFMEQQFAKLGLVAERFEAVTVPEVPQDLVELHTGPGLPYPVSTGDLACGLSHQAIWRRIVERNLSFALILEDDALLSAEIVPFVHAQTLTKLGADILKLETRRRRILLGERLEGVGKVALHELQSSHMGAAAYVISLAAAAASLAHPRVNHFAVDRFLFGKGGPHFLASRIVQAVPSPAIQLDRLKQGDSSATAAQSDIAVARRNRKGRGTQPSRGRTLSMNANHAVRVVRLIVRDPGVVRRKRRSVAFADDPGPPQ